MALFLMTVGKMVAGRTEMQGGEGEGGRERRREGMWKGEV